MELTEKFNCFAAGFITAILCAAVLWVWSTLKPSLPAMLGEAPDKFATTPVETKQCTTVQVLVPKAKKKAGLPAAIVQDEQASLLAVATVPHLDRPQIASAVLHRDTGKGEIYFTPQPRPWLAFDRRGEAGIGYVWKDDALIWQLDARLELVQAKAIRLAVTGTLDGAGDFVPGVRAWANW
ncbi:MAG: hypothetical protein A2Z03_09720 [Chloroflexi bacterium RBG_16_56_8]|nr:MAG: hypothetical protein A2Z03_09720 [Chloroflexi bacterium RBG_16_56_8]